MIANGSVCIDWYVFVIQGLRYQVNRRFSVNPNKGFECIKTKMSQRAPA